MDMLDQLSEQFIHRCLEDLEGLWVTGALPGDDDDNDALEVCPACGEETCQVLTVLQRSVMTPAPGALICIVPAATSRA